VFDAGLGPLLDQPPTDLTTSLVSAVDENRTGILLGTLDVVDADGGPKSVDFGTHQGMFQLSGNELRLVIPDGFNFERTPSFTFDIRVFGSDTSVPAFIRSFTIGVLDQNDAPTGINLQANFAVQEFVTGFEFGTVQVADEDVGETYTYQFSDPRFEVAEGKVKLKPDSSLRHSQDSNLRVEMVATGTLSGDAVREQFTIDVTLAPPPWQNKNWALDVNDDGNITPLDALLIINHLNALGIGPLDTPTPAGSSSFIDVNGDRFVTPLDVLIIINFLNQIQSSPGGGGSSEGGEGEQRIVEVPSQPSIQSQSSVPRIDALSVDGNDIADSKRRRVFA